MSRSKPQSLNERSDRLLGDISSRNRSIKSSEPEDKPLKVKIEGRRRLCKVSSQPAEDPSDAPPASPMPQIRGILNNLTLRLETLWIEKRKPLQTPFSSFSLLSESDSANSSYLSAAGSTDAGDGVGESKGKERAISLVNLDSAFMDEEDCVVSEGNEWDGHDGDVEKGEKSVVSSNNGEDYPERKVAKGKENRVLSTSDGGNDAEKKAMKGRGKSMVSISDGGDDAEKVVATGDKKGVVLVDDDEDDAEKELAEVEYKNVISLHDGEDAESLNSWDGDDVRLSNGSLTYTLPGKIAKTLYQHQRDGLKWLWSLHCKQTGGILGDDMGLGKTMQISAFLAGLFHSNLIKRALVVAPKTLLAHWIKELPVVGLSEKIRE